MALPYVLLPSAAVAQYPLLAGGVQQQGSENPAKLGLGLPAMMTPAHFMVGASPYNVELSGSPLPSPVTPDVSGHYASAAGTPHSPSGAGPPVSMNAPELLVSYSPAHKLTVKPSNHSLY